MERLKIYWEKDWLPAGKKQVIMLYPFLGEVPLAPGDPDIGRFDDYIAKGKEFFEQADTLKDCDMAVLPFEYAIDRESIYAANLAAGEAQKHHKKIVVFYNSDFTSEISIPNSIIFRTSFFKSSKKQNEFAFPGWSVDFQKYVSSDARILTKKEKPEISYCGYIDALQEPVIGVKQKIKNVFKGAEKDMYRIGPLVRGKAVRVLNSDKNIKTNFLIRDGFWAQGIADKNEAREEYARNMLGSPYALVARGAGNFSYRLYEVMSCGRIPVFINTDCVLPFENFIDWEKYMIRVEEKEIAQIGKKISEFHENISEKDFSDLQLQIRKMYEEWLSPVGFFKNLYRLAN